MWRRTIDVWLLKRVGPMVLSLLASSINAAIVDTVQIYSQSMRKAFPALVFQPEESKRQSMKLPVLYLLHGHSSDYAGWNYIEAQLKYWADVHKLIIVCPDGDYSSWYVNSPVKRNSLFETYIAKEIVHYVDKHYPSIRDRHYRGITGVSMGGHGAIYLALKHPSVYGIAGSISGAMDILPFHKEWNLEEVFGPFRGREALWKKYSCLYLIESLCNPNLLLRMDCGTDDFFLQANRQFQAKIKSLNMPHEYREGPGGHDIDYWIRTIEDQVLFFVRQWHKRPE
jgi:S-formylglutathione hydrolase FrmB